MIHLLILALLWTFTGGREFYDEDCYDICSPNPCYNYGICVEDMTYGYKCVCRGGWTGANCRKDVNECHIPSLCRHGICQNLAGSYSCRCIVGWTGQKCDKNVCIPNPCHNGGRCMESKETFICKCTPGYTGTLCESHYEDDVTSEPDQSTTYSQPEQSSTNSQPDQSSTNSELDQSRTTTKDNHNADLCLSSPCRNGGRCVSINGTYRCVCPPQYTGFNCEEAGKQCNSSNCNNNGLCYEMGNNYVCVCFNNSTGENCQLALLSSPLRTRLWNYGILLGVILGGAAFVILLVVLLCMIAVIRYKRKKQKVNFPSILYTEESKSEKDDCKEFDVDKLIPPKRQTADENDYSSLSELMAEGNLNTSHP